MCSSDLTLSPGQYSYHLTIPGLCGVTTIRPTRSKDKTCWKKKNTNEMSTLASFGLIKMCLFSITEMRCLSSTETISCRTSHLHISISCTLLKVWCPRNFPFAARVIERNISAMGPQEATVISPQHCSFAFTGPKKKTGGIVMETNPHYSPSSERDGNYETDLVRRREREKRKRQNPLQLPTII